jgi:hypothetical protein
MGGTGLPSCMISGPVLANETSILTDIPRQVYFGSPWVQLSIRQMVVGP